MILTSDIGTVPENAPFRAAESRNGSVAAAERLNWADAAGLVYSTDALPGIRRRRCGKGWCYLGHDGKTVRDPETLARVRSLAIPPAWTEVWICPDPNGHIQATGRDVRGRKQYRYHYDLFQYLDDDGVRQTIDSGDVNTYLRLTTGADFTAKDFRTWGGTLLAARELRQMQPPGSQREARRSINQVIQRVASMLGNRPATCRKYYVHPAILEAYADGTLFEAVAQVRRDGYEDAPHELDLEEAALLELLERKQAQGFVADAGAPDPIPGACEDDPPVDATSEDATSGDARSTDAAPA